MQGAHTASGSQLRGDDRLSEKNPRMPLFFPLFPNPSKANLRTFELGKVPGSGPNKHVIRWNNWLAPHCYGEGREKVVKIRGFAFLANPVLLAFAFFWWAFVKAESGSPVVEEFRELNRPSRPYFFQNWVFPNKEFRGPAILDRLAEC